jgi:plasmid segregation protein ParM
MNIGLDVGYSAVKAVAGERRVTFPSAVGTPDRPCFSLVGMPGHPRFNLSGNAADIILVQPDHVQVGEGAIRQSRFLQRREDRHWTESAEWYALFLASLTELSDANVVELRIVTGLPIAYYNDRANVRDRLLGDHKVQREGRHAQTFKVASVNVIPQPYGALLAATLDDRGSIADDALATGAVGILDVGGKTTNLLSVSHLSEIGRETASVGVGAWDAVRAVRSWLNQHYPDLELRDHQIVEAVITRQLRYFGEPVNLGEAVDDALEPLADHVIAEALQLWNGGAALDAILVGGGGALLLGPYIRRHFRHARVVEDAVFANALGFYRFAQRLASGA